MLYIESQNSKSMIKIYNGIRNTETMYLEGTIYIFNTYFWELILCQAGIDTRDAAMNKTDTAPSLMKLTF